jgi:hypothetical protein
MPLDTINPFPSVRRYLAALPEGESSYPESVCKGTLVRATLAELPPLSDAASAELPACIARLRATPPDATEWTSTVHHNALVGAVFDARYTLSGMAAYERAAFDKLAKVIEGPLYRVLFTLVGTERLVRASEGRWKVFHRGSKLVVETFEKGRVTALLTYPADLFFDLPARSVGQGLRASVAASGAKGTTLQTEAISPTATRFTIEWQVSRAS